MEDKYLWGPDYDMDHCYECEDCKKKEKRITEAQDLFEGICDILANKEPFNSDKLFDLVVDMSYALHLKTNIEEIKVQEKVSA